MGLQDCLALASKIKTRIRGYKIHDLWDEEGPKVVGMLQSASQGALVWADLKIKDIDKTGFLRARAIRKSGADILTVHTDGEIEMMMAAKEAFQGIVLGVTVLTSLDEERIHLLTGQSSMAAVLYRARLAKLAGLDGIVCSPQEVSMLAKRPELKGLLLVTPSVRSPGKDANDQKRVGTPAGAIADHATHLVIGREVTEAGDPVAALEAIALQIEPLLEQRQATTA